MLVLSGMRYHRCSLSTELLAAAFGLYHPSVSIHQCKTASLQDEAQEWLSNDERVIDLSSKAPALYHCIQRLIMPFEAHLRVKSCITGFIVASSSSSVTSLLVDTAARC